MNLNPKNEFKVTDEELMEEPAQVQRQKAELAKFTKVQNIDVDLLQNLWDGKE